jgi:hypothetical protein
MLAKYLKDRSNQLFIYMFGAVWFEGMFYILNMRIRLEVTKNVMVHVKESPIRMEYTIVIFCMCLIYRVIVVIKCLPNI